MKEYADADQRHANHDDEPVGKQGKPTLVGHAIRRIRKMSAKPPTSAPNHLALCFECTLTALRCLAGISPPSRIGPYPYGAL